MSDMASPTGRRDLHYRSLPGGARLGCGFIAKPDPRGELLEFTAEAQWAVVLVLAGRGTYRDAGSSQPLTPGTLIHRIPGRHHWTVPEPDGQWQEFFLLLPAAWYPALESCGPLAGRTAIWRPGLDRALTRPLFELLPRLRAAADAALPSLCLAMAGWVVEAWTAHRRRQPADDDRLEHARRLLAADLDQRQRPRDIAAALGMEHDAFRRWFRRHTGSAPAAYRDSARLAAAQTLLAGTDLDIAAVATRTGFSDRFAFSKRFRAATGEPPAAFRARHGSRR